MNELKKHFIGIDISKLKLDITVYDSGKNLPENYCCTDNDESGFRSLLKFFKSRKIDLTSVFVCMEHTGIYGYDVCSFFESHGIDYSVVSAYKIKHSLGLVRGKNDVIDSRRIAGYCYLFREELPCSKLQHKSFFRIRDLMAERRLYKKRASQCKAYLTEHKKREVTTTTGRCIDELKTLDSYLKAIEKEVKTLIFSDPELRKNYELLTSITGISFVNSVNILLYTNNFVAFPDARSYACYCGVAPFGYQSGTSIKSAPRVSKMSNLQLKVDLSQSALSAVCHDPELKIYYRRKLSQGKHTGTVLNAVKFKLIERMFAVVKRGTPYVRLGNYSAPSKKAV
jgi:transposase